MNIPWIYLTYGVSFILMINVLIRWIVSDKSWFYILVTNENKPVLWDSEVSYSRPSYVLILPQQMLCFIICAVKSKSQSHADVGLSL